MSGLLILIVYLLLANVCIMQFASSLCGVGQRQSITTVVSSVLARGKARLSNPWAGVMLHNAKSLSPFCFYKETGDCK